MRRRLLAVLAVLPLAAGTAAPASAAWSTSGTGPGNGRAAEMPAASPVRPTVVASGVYATIRTYTVSWTTVRTFDGRPATGYLISRTATLSDAAMSDGTCRGAVERGVAGVYVPADPGTATQTCTDTTRFNLGSVQYTVTPVDGRWIGRPTEPSAPVT